MNSSIFDISEKLVIDDGIENLSNVTYSPDSGSDLNKTIPIQFNISNQNAFHLPYQSYLIIKGRLTNANNADLTENDRFTFTNNAPMFLFSKAEYLIGNQSIESVYEPGKASLLKGLLSYAFSSELNKGWHFDELNDYQQPDNFENNDGFRVKYNYFNISANGLVSFYIPLSHIFGFCEDYKKVIYGTTHTLILTRSSTVGNSLIKYEANQNPEFKITELLWIMPNVKPNLRIEAEFEKLLRNPNKTFDIAFREKKYNEFNIPPQNTDFTWKFGTIESVSKPRYIIIGFQTNRNENFNNSAIFDHCNLEKLTVQLNGENYPTNDIINNFGQDFFETSFTESSEFRQKYYGLPEIINDFPITKPQYKKFYPLFVIDTRFQPEKLKDSIIDITIKGKFRQNIPANTKCNCLILSQKAIKMSTDGSRMRISS